MSCPSENVAEADGDAIEETFSRLRISGVEFFLNGLMEPTVGIPDDSCQRNWPVNGERFKDLVVATYHDVAKPKLMSRSELSHFLAFVREECRNGGLRPTSIEALKIEDSVIVQGIWFLLNEAESLEMRTEHLLERIRELQLRGRITDADRITPFVNVFSRRLNRLKKPLLSLHINVDVIKREDGSHCFIKRLVGFEPESSSVPRTRTPTDDADGVAIVFPSGLSSFAGRDLPLTAGTDGQFRYE